MDRGAWWAAVHGVAQSRTRLSDFTSLTSYFITGEGNGNPLLEFLPGESRGQSGLVGHGPQGRRESGTTEVTEHAHARTREANVF